MGAPAGMELLSEGSWNPGSVSGEWSPGGCGCGSGEPCSCGGSCGCKGEGGGSCGGGRPSCEAPLLPDYDGEIWASPFVAVVDLGRAGAFMPLSHEGPAPARHDAAASDHNADVFPDDGDRVGIGAPHDAGVSGWFPGMVVANMSDGGGECQMAAQPTCSLEVVCEALNYNNAKMPPRLRPDKNPRAYVWHCEIEATDCMGNKMAYGLMGRGEQIGGGGSHVRKSPVLLGRDAAGNFVSERYASRGKFTLPCLFTCLTSIDPCNIDWIAESYPHRNDFRLAGAFHPGKDKNCVTFVAWVMNTLGHDVQWLPSDRGCDSEYAEGGV